MNDVHEVTHCGDCPFSDEGVQCQAPGARVREASEDDWWAAGAEERPPAACPLLIAPALVRIRAKALP